MHLYSDYVLSAMKIQLKVASVFDLGFNVQTVNKTNKKFRGGNPDGRGSRNCPCSSLRGRGSERGRGV